MDDKDVTNRDGDGLIDRANEYAEGFDGEAGEVRGLSGGSRRGKKRLGRL